MSKTPVASLVSVHHLRARAGLVGPVCLYNVTGGISSVAWYFSMLAF